MRRRRGLGPALLSLALGGCWDFGRLSEAPDAGADLGVRDAAAPRDAAADARAAGCSALFCDDFETGQLDPSSWQRDPPVQIVRTPAQGRFAAQLTAGAPGGTLTYSGGKVDGLRHLFVRAAFNVPAASGTTPTLVRIMAHDATGADTDLILYIKTSRALALATHVDATSQTVLPTDAWTCLEMEIDLDSQKLRAYMKRQDDAQPVELSEFRTNLPVLEKPLTVRFGPETAAGPIVYLDDVALSDMRIGCP